jgi:hypothetical protein
VHALPRSAGAAALFPPGGSPYRLTQYSVIDAIRPQDIERSIKNGAPLPPGRAGLRGDGAIRTRSGNPPGR